jgi:ribonuclease P protein component
MILRNESGAETRRFFLRRDNRIQQRADFKIAYENGIQVRRQFIHVFVHKRADPASPTRIGITATRKLGNAVTRNRFKRRIRESLRHAFPDMHPGYDIIVNALRKASTASYANLDENLRSALTKAGVLPASTGI